MKGLIKMKICSEFKKLVKLDNGYLISTNACDIKVIFLTDEIIRIRASFDKVFDEASYVLSTTAWEDRIDSFLGDERKQITPLIPDPLENDTCITFSTQKLKLVFDKNNVGFSLYDTAGNLLHSDIHGNPFVLDSNNRIQHFVSMNDDDYYYGFGEKTGPLNKNKCFLRERATDAMGYDPVKTDTLYKHIPFYIKLAKDTKKAIGYFYHNFYESVFNMGCEKSNYWPRYSYWQADGGDIDLFLISGDKISKVIDNYTFLTGRPALLPKRALGYQGSSMFYPELPKDSDDAVLDFIDTIKKEGFPIDGFHLSSGYTTVNNKRCVFTWNTDRFKNPKEYFKAMNEKGAQNVPNVKPGILLIHPYFNDFLAKDVFVKSSDSNDYATASWWGGKGAFWDFTKEAARNAWKEYLKKNIIQIGTNSIWNDNCEYDSFLDKDARCDYEGMGGTIGQLKPIMSTLMCKVANDAVTENDDSVRPYVVCRSGSSGIQKYAQTWVGDNYSNWETLKNNVPTILGMGLSGQPNEGADIGGFAGPAPEEELFVRWVQHGIFQGRFSIHSASTDNTVTEPWMYHDSAPLIKEAMELRYKLLPYLYSYEYEASKTGAPIMRPLCFEFQDDEQCLEESFRFLFGRDILVANVLDKGVDSIKVYLPKGSKWYLWNDKYTCYEGGYEYDIPVSISSIPMFIREGAIIPKASHTITSMEKDIIRGLDLLVVPGEDRSFEIYNDDGVTNNYKKGCYRKVTAKLTGNSVVKLAFTSEGNYEDFIENMQVEVINKERSPYFVTINDKILPHFLNRHKFEEADEGWYYSMSKRTAIVKYRNPKKDSVLTVSFEDFDLVGM